MADETSEVRDERAKWRDEHDKWHEGDKCDKHHHRHGAEYSMGPIWFIGWLFTIGYLHMPFFWKGVLALIIWPYYLGNILGRVQVP